MRAFVISFIGCTMFCTAIGQTSSEVRISPVQKINTSTVKQDVWRTQVLHESVGQQEEENELIVPEAPVGGKQFVPGPPATNVLTPVIKTGFKGAAPDLSPHDNSIAAGNGFIVSVMNTSIQFTDFNGTELYSNTLKAFFDKPGYLIDPRVIYDPYEDKWIVGATDAIGSGMLVAFSDDSDPNGDWNSYVIKVGTGGLYDYPHIGVTEHQLIISGARVNPFQCYAYQVSKGDGYAGNNLRSKEYIVNGSFTTSVVNTGSKETLFGNKAYLIGPDGVQGGSNMHFHTFTDTIGGNPTLQKTTVSVPAYALAPAVKQKDHSGSSSFYLLGSKIYSAIYKDGKIHFVTNVGKGGSYAVYYGLVDVDAKSAESYFFNLPNSDVQFPSIASLTEKQVAIFFLETNENKYPSNWVVFCDDEGNWSDAVQVKEGTGPLTTDDSRLRWGDYSSVALAYGTTVPTVWVAGEYGAKDMPEGRESWIAEVTADGLVSGINDKEFTNTLNTSVYPNPISVQYFHVDFKLPKSERIDISIYDLNGRKIKSLYKDNALEGENHLSFNKKALQAGTYVLKITNDRLDILEHSKVVVE